MNKNTNQNPNEISWLYKLVGKLFGHRLYLHFIKCGLLYYDVIAISADGKTAHFAKSEWDLQQSMFKYLNENETEEKDD